VRLSGRTTPPAYYKSREVAKLVLRLVVGLVTESKNELRDIYAVSFFSPD
jgi:hypothetical protein